MADKPPKFAEVFAAHPDPAAMAEYARRVWVETVSELERASALDVYRKSRLATVERYSRYRAEFHALYPVLMHEGPLKEGRTGHYVNPGFAIVGRLDEKLTGYDELFAKWAGPMRPPAEMPEAARKYLERSRKGG